MQDREFHGRRVRVPLMAVALGVAGLMAGGVVGCLPVAGQTADPTATPSNPSTVAPPAKPGGYSVSQGQLTVAPGLRIPNGNLPWALDTVGGKPALIPIHHSAITEPASVDTEAEGVMHTLTGAHARTVLRSAEPAFFIHGSDRTENTGDAGRGNPTGWALVSATSQNGSRTLPHVRFAQISQGTACAARVVCLQAEALGDGWVRLTARAPLPPGDYALVPVPRQPKAGVLVLYDFAIDAAAPLPRDAVVAGGGVPVAAKAKRGR